MDRELEGRNTSEKLRALFGCNGGLVSTASAFALLDRRKWLWISFRNTGGGWNPAIWDVCMMEEKPSLAKGLQGCFTARFSYEDGRPDKNGRAAGDGLSHGAGYITHKGKIKDATDPGKASEIHNAVKRQIDRAYAYHIGG